MLEIKQDEILPPKTKTILIIGSLLVSAALLLASIIGIAFSKTVYPEDELLFSFYTNDVIDILIGIPALAVSIWLMKKDHLLGYLILPGALFFVFYNFVVYTLDMPLSFWYPVYPALMLSSAFLVFRMVKDCNPGMLKKAQEGKVFERWSGGMLAFLGIMFFLMAAGKVVSELSSPETGQSLDVGLNLADMLVAIPWAISGVSLWRHGDFGYKTGVGLLFHGNTLFAGLILLLLIRPILLGTEFIIEDIFVLLVMWLVILLPFVLALRKLLRKE